MMIVIFSQLTVNDSDTGLPVSRTANIYLTDGSSAFMYNIGGLPLEGDLQTVLNGMEAELWAAAVTEGRLPTPKEAAKADRLIYLTANPGSKQIFTLSLADVELQVGALVDALFPPATGVSAANKTKLKRILTVGILVNRESVAGE
jgi:hypothetical protein